MSSLRRAARVGVAAALLVAGDAGAQDVRRQAAILDSVAAVQRQIAARKQAFDDSVARARGAMDTLTVGALRLVVQPALRGMAHTAAMMAMDTLRIAGDGVLAMLRPHRIVVRHIPAPRWAPGTAPIRVALLDSSGVEQRPMSTEEISGEVVGNYIIEQARGAIASRVDPLLAGWLRGAAGNPPIRFDTVQADDWSRLRLDLVSAPAAVARRCYDGHLGACRLVLGLDSSRYPVRELFDAPGRRTVVEQASSFLRRRDYVRTDACLAGDDAACIAVLERMPAELPLASNGQRVALLQLAMQQGGPAAPARVFASAEPPAQRLATISGLPTDSLVRLWHTRVRNVRAPSDNMTTGMALASLGWMVLFTVLASRSGRWR